ncbi:MAG: L-seryl-tRNA(Sec) selenium transferase [Phycisphaerales bacterium]|nr:L-seryl-tRNA(Sec) selenium transferase [Phycisphaerales bacterium]
MTPNSLSNIPSVDQALRELGPSDVPRPAVVALVRRELAAIREARESMDHDSILARLRAALQQLRQSRIQPVINGTGILIHTNLGRSPLGPEVVETLSTIAANYNNLEYDLATGERGGRAAYLEHNLAVLCGAPAATVVNNCAAALLLILRHFTTTQRPEVVISRGELIQIGGGFRIPDVLEAGGATLREIGTTNKTSLDDYTAAICERTALVLKVHRSNFYMDGFVESPKTEHISELARRRGIPFVEDLGSGATMRTEEITGVEHEPTPADVLGQGVDLVCFSGDKLLGGPQAGIIAGSAPLVAALKKNPLFRALRCDKLILAGLQTTVDLHLNAGSDKADGEVAIIGMMRAPVDTLRQRATALAAQLAGLPLHATVGQADSQIGGGTLPRSAIPSVTLDLIPTGLSLDAFASKLRAGSPPVVAYISEGRLRIDLRTVFPRQDAELAIAIKAGAEERTT